MPRVIGRHETGSETVDELDILRSARLVMDQHGSEALGFAAGRAVEMHQTGDRDGEAVWCRIIDAIQELGRVVRRPDEQQH